ncbi:SdpI family protein [Roseivirga sp.]|uniref:SdpI family protein n=1 Tax=Roseivirga sp. TaxID=1964215 RepID=UPI003B8C4212
MSDSESIMVHSILIVSSLLVALLAKFVRPDEPNGLTGYRTKRSMRSQEAWDFANDYAGNLIMWTSLFTVCIEIFVAFVIGGETAVIITAVAMTVGMAVAIGFTEYQLSKRFDKQGKPINSNRDRF